MRPLGVEEGPTSPLGGIRHAELYGQRLGVVSCFVRSPPAWLRRGTVAGLWCPFIRPCVSFECHPVESGELGPGGVLGAGTIHLDFVYGVRVYTDCPGRLGAAYGPA